MGSSDEALQEEDIRKCSYLKKRKIVSINTKFNLSCFTIIVKKCKQLQFSNNWEPPSF